MRRGRSKYRYCADSSLWGGSRNVCADKRPDFCVNEEADLCADKRSDFCVNEGADLCADKRSDLCVEEKADLCADERPGLCIDMRPSDRRAGSYRRSFAVLAVLAAVLCGGCGQKKGPEALLDRSEPVTVNIWHYYNGVQQAQFDELVDEFNDTVGSEKGIIVEANSKNSVSELAESVLACVKEEPGADTPPDIFGSYVDTAYQVDLLGKLADLSPYLTDEELDEYMDAYIKEGAFAGEGTLKIFPTAKSTEVMIVNATDWEKFAAACGVTYENLSTWEGLCEVSAQYYDYTDSQTPDVPNDGKAFFGRDSVANYVLVGAKQLGHPLVEEAEDGTVKAQLDKETVRRLWEYFYVPFVKGYFTAESRFRSDDAKIGSIIAMVCSTTGAVYYPEEVTIDDEYTYPIENEVLPLPNFEGCDPYIVQQGAGMCVLKSDEKTEYACSVFLKWFTEAERNIRFAGNSGYLPVKKTANDAGQVEAGTDGIGDTMKKTLQIAIEEIGASELYISPPYDRSSQVRDYISTAVGDTAKRAYQEAASKIATGEDRAAILEEYTNADAFDTWYAEFEAGFKKAAGEA